MAAWWGTEGRKRQSQERKPIVAAACVGDFVGESVVEFVGAFDGEFVGASVGKFEVAVAVLVLAAELLVAVLLIVKQFVVEENPVPP